MKIAFLTFNQGHLVSDKEFDSLKKGFSKVGMELIRGIPEEYDVLMVKGWSHTWEQVVELNVKRKPVLYLSIGTEWKVGNPDNEPIRNLYRNADMVVHIADYCMRSHHAVFGFGRTDEIVIIPAREPNLPKEYKEPHLNLKLATTCIPRPVKRNDQLEELCKKFEIELVPAYGSVSDFSYYHDCDGYIHLSRKEGMPNTVLEAMSYGLPCIVTNYGGAKEAVGDAGIIIKNDPEDVPWDPDNIEPIDEALFEDAIEKFKDNHLLLVIKTKERVLTELNDFVTAYRFKKYLNENNIF